MKNALIIIMMSLVAIQFIRIDMRNPQVDPEKDYINITKAPKDIQSILKSSCYDCHSNETIYPWYANVAPISWYVKDHINEGRSHVNFSEFGDYNSDQKKYILKGLATSVKKGMMPLNSYIWIHNDANLSQNDRKKLIEWFDSFLLENNEQK